MGQAVPQLQTGAVWGDESEADYCGSTSSVAT